MPTPLTAKSIVRFSLTERVIAATSFGVPLAGLVYFLTVFFLKKQETIHFDNPLLNLGAHASLIVCPLVWGWLINYKPVVYESSDADIVLGQSGFLDSLSANWWMMLIMWATPVFAWVALGQNLNARYLPHPEDLHTSFEKALLIMAVVFCLSGFYANILLGRSESTTRISDEGLRTSILYFYKWEDVHHLSQHGHVFSVYHRANSALPATSFKIVNRESQVILERFLSEHHVQISNDVQPAYLLVKFAVVLGFAANLLIDFWLRLHTPLSFISTVLISFGVGIILTLLLEKYRGVSKFSKYKPVVELDLGEAKQL
jgi:hypothetical protein